MELWFARFWSRLFRGRKMSVTYHYPRAKVEEVKDGDTVVLSVDVGFGISLNKEVFRLYGPDKDGKMGLDAPEMKTPAGKLARLELFGILDASRDIDGNVWIEVDTIKDRKEKYGRYLAVLWCKDRITEETINVNQKMIDTGHAKLKKY